MDDITPQIENRDEVASRAATTLRDIEDRARAALSTHRAHIARLEADIIQKLEAASSLTSDALASEGDCGPTNDELRAEADRLRVEAEQARSAWQREKEELDATLAALRSENDSLRESQAQHDVQCDAWTTERTALIEERDKLLHKTTELEAQHSRNHQEWRDQFADIEQRLAMQQETWNSRRAAWDETCADHERERAELQHKFDIALEDVQRFRGRVADLEQELARRPESSQTESAEVVALRSERDALAHRVEELEARSTTQIDAEAEQQFADLQRRFEMAVENVRELKTANAQLEAKLSAGRTPKTSDGDGSDWESMKRRLLASLEEAGDDEVALPQKERISITSTIEMTDALVADKDREIQRLKTELADHSNRAEATINVDRQNQLNELLNTDEVIADHRKRIAHLESELQDKLRAAELELSVERARIARQKAELQELQIELDSRRPPAASNGAAANDPPRRRWLSKLGLGGDEP